ncbi:hypothetical protein GIB67_026870, partial [Kingdonia uniflora]
VALDYIGKRGSTVGVTKEKRIKYVKEILQREMLPHMGVGKYCETKKAYYFGKLRMALNISLLPEIGDKQMQQESPNEGGWPKLVTNGYIEYVDTEEEEATIYDFRFAKGFHKLQLTFLYKLTTRPTPTSLTKMLTVISTNSYDLAKGKASTNQVVEKQMLVYQLSSKILCRVIVVQLKAEADTDKVFAQVTLLPESNI